jgi:plasmid stabilization system protein ParE
MYRLTSGAKRDLRDAVRYYNSAEPGLVERIVLAVEEAIERIVAGPRRWQQVGPYRRCVVKRFPYSIMYSIQEDQIVIVAIAHHSRKPSYWGQSE